MTHKPLQWISEHLIFLPVSGPTLAGRPVGEFLCPFQKKVLTSALDSNGDSRFNLFLGWSRKISKSMMYSWLLNYFLEEKSGFQMVNMASTFGQSAHIYDLVRTQIERNPRINANHYSLTAEKIKNKKKDNTLFRVYNKASSNLGMINISVVAIDQIESMQSRSNIDVIKSGMMMSQSSPLYLEACNPPEHISHWSIDYVKGLKSDKRYRCFDYSASLNKPWDSDEAIRKANPFYNLYRQFPKKYPHLKTLAKNISAECKSAKKNSEESIRYRKYILGQRISSKAYQWISSKDLRGCSLDDVLSRETRCVLGFDLALTRDFCSCIVAFFDEVNNLVFLYPILHVANIDHRTKKQQQLFHRWHEQGHITIQGLPAIDKSIFLSEIKEFLRDTKVRPVATVWDRGLVASEWLKEFEVYGDPMLVRGSPIQITGGIRTLEARAQEGNLYIVDDNPCLKWMFDCALASSKSKGYVGLDRATDSHSIDGCISAVLCQKWILENEQKKFVIMGG